MQGVTTLSPTPIITVTSSQQHSRVNTIQLVDEHHRSSPLPTTTVFPQHHRRMSWPPSVLPSVSWNGQNSAQSYLPFTEFDLPQSSPPRCCSRRLKSHFAVCSGLWWRWPGIWLRPNKPNKHNGTARKLPYLLILYFALNLSLTLQNKSLLITFPFPYTITALHALCSFVGCCLLRSRSASPLPLLDLRTKLVLLAFSSLYTVNILVSNLSLGLVTVPFHQIVRASTPLFTLFFSALILRTRSSGAKLVALLPVIAGVGFATYGDYYFTLWGFFLTLLGTVLAALKTIYTNVLQRPASASSSYAQALQRAPSCTDTRQSKLGVLFLESKETQVFSNDENEKILDSPLGSFRPPPSSLSPMDILLIVSPLAFAQALMVAQSTGELGQAYQRIMGGENLPGPRSLLLFNGAMAFALNIVSFSANKSVGALSMTVAANVKQVLTIVCAVFMFDLTITPMNGFGILVTLIGGALYAWVDAREKQMATKKPQVRVV